MIIVIIMMIIYDNCNNLDDLDDNCDIQDDLEYDDIGDKKMRFC